MSLRTRELVNLLGVGLLTAAGFASVYIARQEVVSTASLSYAGFFLALFLAAHLVVRYAVPNADPYLLPLAGLLCALGLTMIYRIEPDKAFRQGLWIVVGLAAFAAIVLFLRDHRSLDGVKYVLGLTAIGLLVLPAIPGLGRTINGATLWVGVGRPRLPAGRVRQGAARRLPRRLPARQPGAAHHGNGPLGLPSLKHFGPLLLIWGGAMLVLFQTNDLGGALLLFSIFLAMLYIATARWHVRRGRRRPVRARRLALYQVIPHVEDRVGGLARPVERPSGRDATSSSSPSTPSRAEASSAPGSAAASFSRPEGNTYIPFLETDFIYSAITQELGLAGAAAVVLLYVIFLYRGFAIAMRADDGFSKLLAAGLTAALAVQAFIIIGGVTGLIPLTGLTLPFVSYGGSSIVANFILVALLLVVSNHVNRERA